MADKETLNDIIYGRTKPAAAPAAKEAKEPEEGQQDVGPCGMVSVKGCYALDVDAAGRSRWCRFQYVYISVYSEFRPTSFWVLFVGLTSWKVTVDGRNLRPLFDRINDHCLRRIRAMDRDFGADDGKPVVTKIEVQDVSPKERE